jgi:hypothetical protein
MGSLLSVSSGPDHNPWQINAIVESVTFQLTFICLFGNPA